MRRSGRQGAREDKRKHQKKNCGLCTLNSFLFYFIFFKKRVLKPPTTKKRKRQNKREGFTWNRWTFRLMQKKIVFKWRQKEKMFEHRQKKKKDKKTTWNARAQACRPLETEDGGQLLQVTFCSQGSFFVCVFLSKGEGAGGWQMSATLVYLHRTTIISVCSSLNWNAFGFYSEREGFHILLNLNRHYKGF